MKAALQLGLGLALACGLAAQEPGRPVLQNTGKPIRVDFQCTLDDVLWAGLSCSEEEPCPVYLELSAVESVGNRIFAAGNIHSGIGTFYSILLGSEDSGKTWQEVHDRIRGGTLDHLQFFDFETGWVGGQVVYPLPRDVFFLITSNGGKSWRHRPVFSDTRSGSMSQFRFTSRTNGEMVLDRGPAGELGRYERYESPNGGETWMLRETNERRIEVKRPPADAADWRIRADAATSADVLERRQGERWAPVASFAVTLAPCRPAPPPEPEPAPEPDPEPDFEEDLPPAPKPPPPPRRPPTLKRSPK
jgi:hypothetical protein